MFILTTNCSLLSLPLELQYIIFTLNQQVFKVWPLLCRKAALSSRFNEKYKKQGEWRRKTKEGLLLSQRFDNGEESGIYKEWHENGNLKRMCHKVRGLKHGESKRWGPDGRLKEHCFFENDDEIGEYKWWDGSGVLHEYYYEKRIETKRKFSIVEVLDNVIDGFKKSFVAKPGRLAWVY